MKKLFLLASIIALASCTNKVAEPTGEMVTVNVNMSGFAVETEQMSRATAPVSDYCTHLDIWLYESGAEVHAAHQVSTDEGFGTLTLTLNNSKTYTIYAVAHKADGPATLSNGVISWPDDKVTHSFFVSQTFTPTSGMELNLTLDRIVAQFSFNTTDAKPDYVKKMRFTINGVYDRWNVSTGGTHQLDRVSTVTINSTRDDGSFTCNIYAIVTSENTNHDILVESLDATDAVRESHLLQDIPLCNNKRTIATGAFFTNAPTGFSFLAQDWGSSVEYSF